MTTNSYLKEREEIAGLTKKTVAIDFDGVVHRYCGPRINDSSITDGVYPGIDQVIRQLRNDGYAVVIVSSRCRTMKGLHAIEAWLKKNDITVDGVFSTKPAAFVTIDDKAICFDGNADTLVEKVEHFRPYI